MVSRLEPGEPGRQLEQQRVELPVGEPQQELARQPEQQLGLPPGLSSLLMTGTQEGTDHCPDRIGNVIWQNGR